MQSMWNNRLATDVDDYLQAELILNCSNNNHESDPGFTICFLSQGKGRSKGQNHRSRISSKNDWIKACYTTWAYFDS